MGKQGSEAGISEEEAGEHLLGGHQVLFLITTNRDSRSSSSVFQMRKLGLRQAK